MPQGTFHLASWCGIDVAVKKLGEGVIVDEDKVKVCELQMIFTIDLFFKFYGL